QTGPLRQPDWRSAPCESCSQNPSTDRQTPITYAAKLPAVRRHDLDGAERLGRDAGCFEGLAFAVVVIGADDLVVSEAVDKRVLAIKLDTAAHSLRMHANNDDYSVAGVYELLRLEAIFGPRLSPVPKPAFNA